MELAPSTGPWTAAVAWARPWHRPSPIRPMPATPRVLGLPAAPVACAGSSDVLPGLVLDTAWNDAVAGLRAAREALARVACEVDDPWLLALASQEVLRARRRVLEAQEALTGAPADLPWSSS